MGILQDSFIGIGNSNHLKKFHGALSRPFRIKSQVMLDGFHQLELNGFDGIKRSHGILKDHAHPAPAYLLDDVSIYVVNAFLVQNYRATGQPARSLQ